MAERLLMEVRYAGGETERVYPAAHPDMSLEQQAELLRQYVIRQMAAQRPLAVEVDPQAGPRGAERRREARVLVPAAVIRSVEVSILQGAPAPADEYVRPRPQHLKA